MKIETQKPEFTPITITIESQEEAELLVSILAVTGGGYAGDVLYKLFLGLGGNKTFDKSRFRVVTGSVRVEETVVTGEDG